MKETKTVKELIELLSKLTKEQKDYKVWTEGCDCNGDVAGLEVDDEDKTVLIERTD